MHELAQVCLWQMNHNFDSRLNQNESHSLGFNREVSIFFLGVSENLIPNGDFFFSNWFESNLESLETSAATKSHFSRKKEQKWHQMHLIWAKSTCYQAAPGACIINLYWSGPTHGSLRQAFFAPQYAYLSLLSPQAAQLRFFYLN